MSEVMPSTAELAVQPSTPNQINSANGVSCQQPSFAEPTHLIALRQAFEAAIVSRLFTGDKKVVEKAIAALAIPDPDARFRKQFADVARRNLLAKAAADEHGNIRNPSQEAINAEVERLIANLKAKKAA